MKKNNNTSSDTCVFILLILVLLYYYEKAIRNNLHNCNAPQSELKPEKTTDKNIYKLILNSCFNIPDTSPPPPPVSDNSLWGVVFLGLTWLLYMMVYIGIPLIICKSPFVQQYIPNNLSIFEFPDLNNNWYYILLGIFYYLLIFYLGFSIKNSIESIIKSLFNEQNIPVFIILFGLYIEYDNMVYDNNFKYLIVYIVSAIFIGFNFFNLHNTCYTDIDEKENKITIKRCTVHNTILPWVILLIMLMIIAIYFNVFI